MEIRDPIHGAIEITPPETAVIDHPFFQRLRQIKQLGFTEFSYPGATHNRYGHSVGAMHLAGKAFDSVFCGFSFNRPEMRWRMRQAVRLAALLHDVGHGPLSHTSEEVMPRAVDLKIPANQNGKSVTRRATHEDYTLKIILDSSLTSVIRNEFSDIEPLHIAALIDRSISLTDDSAFCDSQRSFRPLLSQIVSSEIDADRLDYLARDSYYCGTSYGKVDQDWLLASLRPVEVEDQWHLGLSSRALYTFDDFLISRYHMYLMVYFHHKAIIYDEMLVRYLRSPDCTFRLPSSVEDYLKFDDTSLTANLKRSTNPWAQMIVSHTPYRMLIETHDPNSFDLSHIRAQLEKEGMAVIEAHSTGKLSKYAASHSGIFVVEEHDPLPKRILPIEQSTEVFKRYEARRVIERLYVHPKDFNKAQAFLVETAKP